MVKSSAAPTELDTQSDGEPFAGAVRGVGELLGLDDELEDDRMNGSMMPSGALEEELEGRHVLGPEYFPRAPCRCGRRAIGPLRRRTWLMPSALYGQAFGAVTRMRQHPGVMEPGMLVGLLFFPTLSAFPFNGDAHLSFDSLA